MTERYCICADWKVGIAAVNAPHQLQQARNPSQHGYAGPLFKFCPWCGFRLMFRPLSDVRATDPTPAEPR